MEKINLEHRISFVLGEKAWNILKKYGWKISSIKDDEIFCLYYSSLGEYALGRIDLKLDFIYLSLNDDILESLLDYMAFFDADREIKEYIIHNPKTDYLVSQIVEEMIAIDDDLTNCRLEILQECPYTYDDARS